MDIVPRAVVAYVFILFLMRVVGRRELSSMEPSDVILLVVIGDLVQNGVTQSDYSITGIVLAAGTIGLLATLTAYATFRSSRIRNVVEGEPVILVEDGKLIERNMKNERLTLDEVMEQARLQQGVESLGDVRWAVLETSGSISIVKKE
ncbi:MAG: DUF421 domain-containing protein [Actinobacteria bacterium]|nr:MAG: DUF421 domain-containing protein [Actinomycetota bacterium]